MAIVSRLPRQMLDIADCDGGFFVWGRLMVKRGSVLNVVEPAGSFSGLDPEDQGFPIWGGYLSEVARVTPGVERCRRIVRAAINRDVDWMTDFHAPFLVAHYDDAAGIMAEFMDSSVSAEQRVADALLLYQLTDAAAWLTTRTIADNCALMRFFYASHVWISDSAARHVFSWICFVEGIESDAKTFAAHAEIFARREAAKAVWRQARGATTHQRLIEAADRWLSRPRNERRVRQGPFKTAFKVGNTQLPWAVREAAFRAAVRQAASRIIKGAGVKAELPSSLHTRSFEPQLSIPQIQPDSRDVFEIDASTATTVEGSFIEIDPNPLRQARLLPVIMASRYRSPALIIVGYAGNMDCLRSVDPAFFATSQGKQMAMVMGSFVRRNPSAAPSFTSPLGQLRPFSIIAGMN